MPFGPHVRPWLAAPPTGHRRAVDQDLDLDGDKGVETAVSPAVRARSIDTVQMT